MRRRWRRWCGFVLSRWADGDDWDDSMVLGIAELWRKFKRPSTQLSYAAKLTNVPEVAQYFLDRAWTLEINLPHDVRDQLIHVLRVAEIAGRSPNRLGS